MNLICFPHYTAGGLLCDIFQRTFSAVGTNKGISSITHNLGKIGDSASIFDQYDPKELMEEIQNIDADSWIGTHCHPHLLDLTKFSKVILITTTTSKSKIYRWLRAYYHYYNELDTWTCLSGIDRIDKERETAKNYLLGFNPLHFANTINIEFAEIVENSAEFKHLTKKFLVDKHLDRWCKINSFLYDSNLWMSAPVARFYEAELETNLNTWYKYE
jgi:hypothetical protein